MTDNESVPSYPIANILQTIFQGVIAFTAGIYTIGFVVVNSHFIKFGITDYGLVQARYIAAGLNYAAIHIGIAAMIAIIFAAFTTSRGLVWLLAFLLLWGLLGVATYVVGRQIGAALMTGANALVISLLAHQVTVGRTNGDSRWYEQFLSSYGVSRQSLLITLTVGAALLVTISTVTWGKSLWPLMGSTLGGGRPASAVLAIKQDDLPILDYHLIPMQNEHVSAQLPVLFENSDGYVVLISLESANTVAVRLPRSAVTTVIYAPMGLGGRIMALPKISPASRESAPLPLSATPTPNNIAVPPKQ